MLLDVLWRMRYLLHRTPYTLYDRHIYWGDLRPTPYTIVTYIDVICAQHFIRSSHILMWSAPYTLYDHHIYWGNLRPAPYTIITYNEVICALHLIRSSHILRWSAPYTFYDRHIYWCDLRPSDRTTLFWAGRGRRGRRTCRTVSPGSTTSCTGVHASCRDSRLADIILVIFVSG